MFHFPFHNDRLQVLFHSWDFRFSQVNQSFWVLEYSRKNKKMEFLSFNTFLFEHSKRRFFLTAGSDFFFFSKTNFTFWVPLYIRYLHSSNSRKAASHFFREEVRSKTVIAFLCKKKCSHIGSVLIFKSWWNNWKILLSNHDLLASLIESNVTLRTTQWGRKVLNSKVGRSNIVLCLRVCDLLPVEVLGR